MNLTSIGGVVVFCSLFMSVCMLTVSKALLMSRETSIVLLGGAFWLKPLATVFVMFCRAVTVECWALKPCWKSSCGRFCVRDGRIVFSRHLARGERSDIGR